MRDVWYLVMATLIQSEFVFRSGTPPEYFTFTIVSDATTDRLSVRDIEDRYGMIVSPYTRLPQSVTDDINTAMAEVEGILSLASAINGNLVFVAQTSKDVLFAAPTADTNYRVQISSSVFAPLRVTNKLLTGFTIQAGTTITGQVGYDVFI